MSHCLDHDCRTRVLKGLDFLMLGVGSTALLAFLVELGWPLTKKMASSLSIVTHVIMWIFVGQEILRLWMSSNFFRYLCKNAVTFVFALLTLGECLFEGAMLSWLHGLLPGLAVRKIIILYVGLAQVIVMGGMFLSILRINEYFSLRKMSPGILLIISFFLLITFGGCLLKMPNATKESISWLDALFTSTSASCVTGLVVVDTATRFTFLGQLIILLLIQVGGLGVMTLTYFLARLVRSGISLKDRILLRDLLSEDNMNEITSSLVGIVLVTLLLETCGSGLLYYFLSACPASEIAGGSLAFMSIFHSISAFCNAGFSTCSNNLAEPFLRGCWGVQIAIMILIILGGLGFPVLKELFSRGFQRMIGLFRGLGRGPKIPLSVHSKVVLYTTSLLILGGFLLIFTVENIFTENFSMSGQAIMDALFNAVTPRTAGFNTLPIGSLMPATALLLIALMYIGGSPAGTAGGIKTTTFAVAVTNLTKNLRQKNDLEMCSRKIPAEIINRAFAIALLSLCWIGFSVLFISVLQPKLSTLDVLFETVSAFGTVGLSRGITNHLLPLSKGVLILNMFVGRIGILTVIFAIVKQSQPQKVSLPQETLHL